MTAEEARETYRVTPDSRVKSALGWALGRVSLLEDAIDSVRMDIEPVRQTDTRDEKLAIADRMMSEVVAGPQVVPDPELRERVREAKAQCDRLG